MFSLTNQCWPDPDSKRISIAMYAVYPSTSKPIQTRPSMQMRSLRRVPPLHTPSPLTTATTMKTTRTTTTTTITPRQILQTDSSRQRNRLGPKTVETGATAYTLMIFQPFEVFCEGTDKVSQPFCNKISMKLTQN